MTPRSAHSEASLTRDQLLGFDAGHCRPASTVEHSAIKLQPAVVQAFLSMQQAAHEDGIRLEIASGFRDFARQEAIWNRKVTSQCTEGTALQECIQSVLRWSALPGLSRHHWGTDMDLYDPVALGQQTLHLEAWEYEAGGHQAVLFQWLNQHAMNFGFYRPYQNPESNGVAAEPWHWSFAPLASQYQAQLLNDRAIPEFLQYEYQNRELAGHPMITHQIAYLIRRYIGEVDPAPKTALDFNFERPSHQGPHS